MNKTIQKGIRWIYSLMAVAVLSLFTISASAQSVETAPPVAPDQEPAFPEQTRAPEVRTQTNFNVEIVSDELEQPWGLDFLPNGRIIVSERPGSIRIVTMEGDVSNAIEGVPQVRGRWPSGLLDIKLPPDFTNSRLVFWAYVKPVDDDQGVNCVSRGRLSSDETTFENVEEIYCASTPYPDHFHVGSRMLIDEDGVLYVTIGDRFEIGNGVTGKVQPQELNSPLGKILRINQDGSPAEGNPFISTSGALDEIWSLGHRNPQGLARNPVTGDLWESEHGPRAGDEINIIQPGANYGWPIISYGLGDDGEPVGEGITQKEGLEQPVYYWDPVVAPSGMAFYADDQIPEWENNLFVATLRGSHIIRLVIDNSTSRIVGEEKLLVDEEQRFRHVVQGPDGALYALTEQGRIYRIGI